MELGSYRLLFRVLLVCGTFPVVSARAEQTPVAECLRAIAVLGMPEIGVEDPLRQVDPAHPFELALKDGGARSRLQYLKESLTRRKVKKKAYVTDREVRIVSSDENPAEFTAAELASPAPVIVALVKRVDENINGTLHGVISEIYLGELELSEPTFREALNKSVDRIVAEARRDPRFRDREVTELKRQAKRTLFYRMVWMAKQEFYETVPAIRPPYAEKWSSDPNDKLRFEQQALFYAKAEHDPIDADFARFVIPQPMPGVELPFISPPYRRP